MWAKLHYDALALSIQVQVGVGIGEKIKDLQADALQVYKWISGKLTGVQRDRIFHRNETFTFNAPPGSLNDAHKPSKLTFARFMDDISGLESLNCLKNARSRDLKNSIKILDYCILKQNHLAKYALQSLPCPEQKVPISNAISLNRIDQTVYVCSLC